MRYRVTGDGWSETFAAHLDHLARNWTIVDEQNRSHPVEVQPLEGDRMFRVIIGSSTHTLTLLPGNRPGQRLRFLFDDCYHELEVRDEIDLLTEVLAKGGAKGGHEEVRSIMPGVIRKLLVEEGATVELEQPLLVLEAMKMENEVRAPVRGTVHSIRVTEGVAVAAGDLLAVIDVK